MKGKFIAALLVIGAALAGCSNEDTAPKVAVAEDSKGGQIVGIARRPAQTRTYGKRLDLTAPFRYGDAMHGLYRDLYWSAAAENPAALAEAYLPEYRLEADSFKRQDMLKSRKSELGDLYEQQQSARNVSVVTPAFAEVGGYDTARGGFLVQPPAEVGLYMVNRGKDKPDDAVKYGVQVMFTQFSYDAQPFFLAMAEEQARSVESYLSGKRQQRGAKVKLRVQVNGYVVAAIKEGNMHYAFVAPDEIVLVDDKTLAPVVTIAADKLPAVIPVNYPALPYIPATVLESLRNTLGIKEDQVK